MVDRAQGGQPARHWHGAAVQSRYSYQVWPRPPTFAKLLSRNYFPLPFLTRAFASFTWAPAFARKLKIRRVRGAHGRRVHSSGDTRSGRRSDAWVELISSIQSFCARTPERRRRVPAHCRKGTHPTQPARSGLPYEALVRPIRCRIGSMAHVEAQWPSPTASSSTQTRLLPTRNDERRRAPTLSASSFACLSSSSR